MQWPSRESRKAESGEIALVQKVFRMHNSEILGELLQTFHFESFGRMGALAVYEVTMFVVLVRCASQLIQPCFCSNVGGLQNSSGSDLDFYTWSS